jgi:hypothetical protein
MIKNRIPSFYWNVHFSGPQTNFNASFVPFLTTFTKFLWPSNAFLQIYLGKFNKHIFQVLTYFLISCGILACFGKNMIKIGSLKAFFQIKNFTFNYKFQNTSQCI